MLRRDFLRKTAIALAGGLLVGDAALEAFERLTHRKVWAGADFDTSSLHGLTTSTYPLWNAAPNATDGRLTMENLKRAIRLIEERAGTPWESPPIILSMRQDKIRRRKLFWGADPWTAALEAQVS